MIKNSESRELQAHFLKGIEDIIPANTSLVNELTDVLEISMDSAYRRMRGETLLTIDEINRLCEHYRISFDAFTQVKSGMVTFSYSPLEPLAENFDLYHKSLLNELNFISSAKESKIIYACQDIPVFHHYCFPELANFKVFYWKRSIMNIPELAKAKYGSGIWFSEQLEIGQAIIEAYSRIPSIEIWTDNTIQSTIKQIKFYWDSGVFETRDDAIKVCHALRREMRSIEKKAEFGSKEIPRAMWEEGSQEGNGHETGDNSGNYQVFVSDIEITNNCVLVNVGSTQAVYLGHFSFSTMSTRNDTYCKKTEAWLSNIIRKSTLISGVSEKQRYQFFRQIYDRIDQLILYIEKE